MSGRNAAVYASVYNDFQVVHKLFPLLVPKPGAREISSGRYSSFIRRLYAVDQSSYLESLLLRQDKMSMAASVEARVPFVHLPLAKILNTIPRRIMSPGKATKPVLKKIAEKYLPINLIYRRKNGLLLPYNEWLKDSKGLGRFLTYLTEPSCKLNSYCEIKELKGMVGRFLAGEKHADPKLLMRLINVEIWLRQGASLSRN